MTPEPPARRRAAFAAWLGTTNDITRRFLAAGAIPDLVNLAGGLPPPESFPAAELAALAREAVAGDPGAALGYTAIEGLAPLRDAIAARFSTPALRLGRANVLVTAGAMQGLDLVGKVLIDPGATVAVQAPTYLGALDAWRPRAPVFRPVDLEAASLDAAAAFAGAAFAYAVPNFSNPTGRLVGIERRRALVEAARRTGTWLVEDDPYGLLLYEGTPLPGLLELSAEGSAAPYDGPVIRLGTLSKSVAPGLRLGWAIAAPAVIEAMTIAKQGSDMFTGGLVQRIALGALVGGLIERQAPVIRALYRERRDALLAAMDAALAAWFDWEAPVGGMFVWAVARDPGFDSDRLLGHALRRGVTVTPSSVFDPEGRNRRAIRLNFTLNPPARLSEGVRRLAAALGDMARGAD